MSINVFLYKYDVRKFVRRNIAKFIVFSFIVFLALIFAIKNVLSMPSVSDFFENKNSSLFSFLKGESAMLTLAFISFLEIVANIFLLLLFSFNDFTTWFYFLLVWVKAYSSFRKILVILLYFGVKALPLFVLYFISLLFLIFCLVLHAICIINSHLRLKYGINELKCILTKFSYVYVFYAIAVILTLISVGIGALFI
jgi:hypothetical protein